MASNDFGPYWPYPRWIAHRGAGRQAPENTLAAFRLGAQKAWRMFECDVTLSMDGEPFLLHDETLDRTSNGSGLAHKRKWKDLSQLDAGSWHSPLYAGEPLPRLESVVRFCLRHGYALNIEIKATPERAAKTGRIVAEHVARLWVKTEIQPTPPPLLSSFEVQALAAARRARPELPRALLIDAFEPLDRLACLKQAKSLGCCAMGFNHTLLDAAWIAQLHAQDLRVLGYTVDDAAIAEGLWQAGIDGLITDAVHEFDPREPVLNEASSPKAALALAAV